MAERNERHYSFECPVCQSMFTYDQPAEPMCTGPGWQTQHDATVMHRVRVKDLRSGLDRLVAPGEGEARAKGTLWLPWNLVTNEKRVNGELWAPKKDDPNWGEHEETALDTIRKAEEEAQE